MNEIKKTISSIFITPTLKIGKERLRVNGYINAYTKDKGREIQYEDSCYLLFKPSKLELFDQFLNEEYARSKHLIDDYDYDGGFVVMVYKLIGRFVNDFELIKQGKYSKTSELFQSEFDKMTKVIKNGVIKEETSLQYRIFNKTEDLRKYWEDRIDSEFKPEMEVWSGWDEEKETLDIEKIKLLL